MTCDLCRAKKITRWIYEDNICWVALCKKCMVPMVVWKKHGVNPSGEEERHMLAVLRKCGAGVLDKERRSIPDHWHVHMR